MRAMISLLLAAVLLAGGAIPESALTEAQKEEPVMQEMDFSAFTNVEITGLIWMIWMRTRRLSSGSRPGTVRQ